MKIYVEEQGALGANCYMLLGENTAVCIDPSAITPKLAAFLTEHQNKQLFIVATHRHYDHIAAIADIKARFGGTVAVSEKDACGLRSVRDSLAAYFGFSHNTVEPDIFLKTGKNMLGDIEFEVLDTPGHTEGSVCLITGDVMFSGDTLFRLSIGRTDFPSGNAAEMQHSLEKLFSLPRDYTVYPGHGEKTSLYFEKLQNPYYIREF